MKKRLMALALTAAVGATALTGCGGGETAVTTAAATEAAKTEAAATTAAPATEAAPAAEGSVYYLNFKPEQDQQWQDLAKVYTEQTGVFPADKQGEENDEKI